MFQLIQPIWLIAMTGIAVPVIVHLWNDRPGKVFAIGSIALLEKNDKQQSRSRRLSEWLLLLLRCLLLIFLALLLCGPFWKRNPDNTGIKGWVLLEKGGIGPYKPMIDSLLRSGYVLHEWGKGNEMGDGHEHEPSSYWTLFEQADHHAAGRIPFYVFTTGRLNRFTGSRPATQRSVHWYTYPPVDSASEWIEAAWLSTPDSIRVLTGSSKATGSSYSYQELPARTGGKGYHIGLVDGRLSVALDSQPAVMVDTSVLCITIVADHQYSGDSRYIAAAIRAWQEFTRINIRLFITDRDRDAMPGAGGTRVNGAGIGGTRVKGAGVDGAAQRPDWLFWLSSQPVPSGDAAANILLYEQGREMPVDSWVQEGSGSDGGAAGGVELTRVIVPESLSGDEREAGNRPADELAGNQPGDYQPVWKDGYGRPVLARERNSGKSIFHFYSHFDPAWNGLVWSPSFPVLLQDLFTGRGVDPGFTGVAGGGRAADRRAWDLRTWDLGASGLGERDLQARNLQAKDLRVLDPEQAQPGDNSGKARPAEAARAGGEDLAASGDMPGAGKRLPAGSIDLAPACWVLIFLILLAERLVSFLPSRADRQQPQKAKSYG